VNRALRLLDELLRNPSKACYYLRTGRLPIERPTEQLNEEEEGTPTIASTSKSAEDESLLSKGCTSASADLLLANTTTDILLKASGGGDVFVKPPIVNPSIASVMVKIVDIEATPISNEMLEEMA